MKNLNKEMLINELIKEKAILREINRTIVTGKITNEINELHEWKYLTMGGILMLRSLIERLKI